MYYYQEKIKLKVGIRLNYRKIKSHFQPPSSWLENTALATYIFADSVTAISRLRDVQIGLKKSASEVEFAKKY